MKVQKVENSYLSYDEVATTEKLVFEIISEGRPMFDKGLDKLVHRCGIRLDAGIEKIWTINATCWNKLIDAFGDDTLNWVGKKVTAYAGKSKRGGKMIDIEPIINEKEQVKNEVSAQ